MNQPIEASQACSNCGAANATGAKFCSDCGAQLGKSPESTQQKTSSQSLPVRGIDFSQFAGGNTETSQTVAMNVETAFEHVVDEIKAAGGQIGGCLPPRSARFLLIRKRFLDKGTYSGELTVSPAGERNSLINLSLILDRSSRIPSYIAISIFIVLFATFTNPHSLLFWMVILALLIVFDLYLWGSTVPKKIREDILKGVTLTAGAQEPGEPLAD